MRKPREITETVYKVLDQYGSAKRNITQIRIVSWNNLPPTLEKRNMYYADENQDELKLGRISGFRLRDFNVIAENLVEIRELLSKDPTVLEDDEKVDN